METARDEVQKLLTYDASTGVFTWRVRAGSRIKVGDVAGRISSTGCVDIGIYGKQYKAHRLAWLYIYGALPEGSIDHINGDRQDNRIANLRIATPAENQQNRRLTWQNQTGFVGIRKTAAGKYVAAIRVNRIKRYIGTYDSPEEAHAAYISAKIQHHPFFGGRV